MNKNINLSNQSWMASLQHQNWRLWSTEKIGRSNGDELRYTGVHSISRKDFEKLRRQVREFLIQTDQLIRPSEEETVCVFCIDLLEI